MNPDKNTRLFIVLLAAGLLLVGTTVFLQGQSIIKMQKSLSTIAESIDNWDVKPEPEAEENRPLTTSERRLLTIVEANTKIEELESLQEIGDWNSEFNPAKINSEPLLVDTTTLHLPYDPTWGNDMYELDTFDELNSEIYFGPMHANFLTSAYRSGSVRVIESRSLDAALNDSSYTTIDCSGQETFKPVKVKVKNIDAIRFEGEACEGGWVGFEVKLPKHNVVLISSSPSNEDLVRWVLERM
jgi:hypothetical protein